MFYFFMIEDFNYKLEYSPEFQTRLDHVSKVSDVEQFIPWFLQCNPKRFPYWFGEHDSRNVLLFQKLSELKNQSK